MVGFVWWGLVKLTGFALHYALGHLLHDGPLNCKTRGLLRWLMDGYDSSAKRVPIKKKDAHHWHQEVKFDRTTAITRNIWGFYLFFFTRCAAEMNERHYLLSGSICSYATRIHGNGRRKKKEMDGWLDGSIKWKLVYRCSYRWCRLLAASAGRGGGGRGIAVGSSTNGVEDL